MRTEQKLLSFSLLSKFIVVFNTTIKSSRSYQIAGKKIEISPPSYYSSEVDKWKYIIHFHAAAGDKNNEGEKSILSSII